MVAIVSALSLAAACSASPATIGRSLSVHVTGGSSSKTTGQCFFRIQSRIVGGGTLTYCLKTVISLR